MIWGKKNRSKILLCDSFTQRRNKTKKLAVKIQTRRKPTALVLQRNEIRQNSDFGIIMSVTQTIGSSIKLILVLSCIANEDKIDVRSVLRLAMN